jgi:D-alanyl-D-alanine carboxypeptidase/D-alanyl-D-alanine-endopeptidase (penicillin-binding protein 4)
MHRALAAAVCCLVLAPAGPAAAATRADASLANQLAQALRVPHVSPTRSAAVVLDLDTGDVVFRQRSSQALLPASAQKLPLTYALLTALGPTFRIETTAQAVGEFAGTSLRGDLYLVGGGDPSLTGADLATLAAQVRESGIRRVDGRLLGDETLFDTRRTAPGWKPSFYIQESPPLSALVVDRGKYGGRVSSAPALAATLLFRDALRRAGVTVTGEVALAAAPADAELGALVRSAPLGALVAYMDRESDNFTAEMLLKQLALLQAERGTTAAGAQTVMRMLGADGIPLAGVRFVDGSGLSLQDRLTADALVAILEAIWDDPVLQPVLLRALPVAGKSGTLRGRMRTPPLRGNVRAKTGTTSRASALAGYVRNRYVFAILQNGSPLSYWWARKAQDRFATVLAAQ